MKKIIRVLSLVIAPLVCICTFLAGCKSCGKKVEAAEMTGIMKDINTPPSQKAAYEQYTRQAINEYKAVAEKHTVNGEVDEENEEVVKTAAETAAKLFAYACYNERTLDKYVYFSNQVGKTDLGISGSATALRQEYYLRVNEGADTCGYRYHYTIKKVQESSGAVAGFKSLFENARMRFTDETNLLYRFEGDKIKVGEPHERLDCELLTCEWKTGEDWAKPDAEMKKSEYLEPADIRADIEEHAGEDNITIRGNINILADGIVKKAFISDDEEGGVFVMMYIDTEVANRDEASLKMLRKSNSSNDCKWVGEDGFGLMIVFNVWDCGLFKSFFVSENWSGKISGFSGEADSVTSTYYSYSDRDCDMTENLEMLARANEALNKD